MISFPKYGLDIRLIPKWVVSISKTPSLVCTYYTILKCGQLRSPVDNSYLFDFL